MTTLLLARCAVEALEEAGLPAATVQCFFDAAHEDIHRLVEHPAISSVAFTGSEHAGLSIKEVADRSGTLCSLEMSSLNPVVVFPGLDDSELDGFIEQWSGSILMGSGQFCTKPGVAFVIGDESLGRRINEGMTERFAAVEDPVLLANNLPIHSTPGSGYSRTPVPNWCAGHAVDGRWIPLPADTAVHQRAELPRDVDLLPA